MDADQQRDPTDWESSQPVDRIEGTGELSGNAIQWRWWNLFLAVPLVMLFTPLYNAIEPQLFGMPLFYWLQFAFVFVGVASVAIVYVTTRGRRAGRSAPDDSTAERRTGTAPGPDATDGDAR